MDGLPLTEHTDLPFASKVKAIGAGGIATGVMHACGHDTHMTAWIGAARRLAAMKSHWSGTLVMIGQPAEERVAGAKKMLDDGLFTRFPKPDTVIAFHDTSGLPAGVIGYTDGPCLLYTSDAADERSSVDLGGRRIIKKKTIVLCVRWSIPTYTTSK